MTDASQRSPAAPAEPTHPEWPVWSCEITAPKDVKVAKPWSVGDKYILNCEGSVATGLKEDPVFEFPLEEQIFTLHPLKVLKADANTLSLEVTSYKPGAHSLKWIEIGDGTSGFRAENLSFEVKSVLSPGQPQQPIQHVNALGMVYPIWMWIAILLIIIVPALVIIQKIRRRTQIKKLVEKLATSSSALRPYDQFSKDVRGLVRQYNYHRDASLVLEFVPKLNEAFKTYLTRAFKLPALIWTPGEFVGEVKHRHGKAFKDIIKDLKNGMIELNKAENAGLVSADDADQLKKLAMVLGEKIYKLQEDKAKR